MASRAIAVVFYRSLTLQAAENVAFQRASHQSTPSHFTEKVAAGRVLKGTPLPVPHQGSKTVDAHGDRCHCRAVT
jgi:hypothetical protein